MHSIHQKYLQVTIYTYPFVANAKDSHCGLTKTIPMHACMHDNASAAKLRSLGWQLGSKPTALGCWPTPSF